METEILGRILGEHPFFRDMKEHHLQAIVECATVVRFEPGDMIFEEGEPVRRFCLIRSVQITRRPILFRCSTLQQDRI